MGEHLETKTQTELEKRIEAEAARYVQTCRDNMHSVYGIAEAYCKSDFKAGAKFILEMPEVKEVVEALKAYANAIKDQTVCVSIDYDDLDADDFDIIEEFESGEPNNFGFRARQTLDKLRALGLV